jgi:hypothetical protein
MCERWRQVLIQPTNEEEWLEQTDDALTLRRCAYWISLEGLPAKDASSSVRISVPRRNVLSAEALNRLFAELRSKPS